ncbi:MAG: sigma-70 family RNA polymerase sigma factor [Bryobacterales bacterium]|nr:sigma-70 family RNA polymerase sigma factor [Bryobacterales bacterium]
MPEDLVRETMLRMVRSLKDLRSREHLKPWMFRIARGVLADYWRRRNRGHLDELDSEALAASDTGSTTAANELAGCLRVFTSRLPEPYREVVELSELAELPHREIASRLGLSISGVKSRVQRGREHLKRLVLECCSVDLYGGEVRSIEPKTGCAGTEPCGCG